MNTKAVILITSAALSLLAFVTYAEEMHMKEAMKYAKSAAKAPDGKVDARLVELLRTHANHAKANKATEVAQSDLIASQ